MLMSEMRISGQKTAGLLIYKTIENNSYTLEDPATPVQVLITIQQFYYQGLCHGCCCHYYSFHLRSLGKKEV